MKASLRRDGRDEFQTKASENEPHLLPRLDVMGWISACYSPTTPYTIERSRECSIGD